MRLSLTYEWGEENMKTYVVTMYVSIEAETEEEARDIAFALDVVPKIDADKDKLYYDAQNNEVDEPLV
jgi:hypothetical protein